MTSLDTILFDKNNKTIVRRSLKRLKIGDQLDVFTVTENTIMQGTNEDPQFLASAQPNADNVNKLVGDAEHYKERMLKMKDTLVKEREERRELKWKNEATFSEFERLQKDYQYLELEKDALDISIIIMEGEKKYLEDKFLELEAQKYAANKQVEELRTWG